MTRLILLAHGSPDPRSGESARAIAYAVYAEICFLEHDEPAAVDVLARSDEPAVLVPLLLTDAFHGKVDVPRVVIEARSRRPGLQVTVLPVLGTDERLLGDVGLRLREAGASLTDPRTVIVFAAAGSTDAAALRQLEDRARLLSELTGRRVRPAYASSAQPDVATAVREELAAGARVCVASYLLSPGVLADRIERAAYDAGAEVVSAPLGAAPGVVAALTAGHPSNR